MLELIISMTLWGTLGAFVLWSGLTAIDIAFYRCLIGVVLVGAWLIKSKSSIKLDKGAMVAALSGIFLVTNWFFLFKSFQISSITIGNISYYLQPVILIVLGIFFYQEKVNFQKWILMICTLGGVALTIDLRNLSSPNITLGVLFALMAALLYSFLTILMKNNSLHYMKVIFIQLAMGVLILLPFIHFQPVSYLAIGCLLIIGIIHTLLAYFLYYKAIKKTSFTQIAILSYLDPIVAIISDVIFFNRQLNFYQVIGIVLTFSALYLLVTSNTICVETVEPA